MPELLLLGLFAAVIGAAAAFGPDTRDPRYRLFDPRAGRSTPPNGSLVAGSAGSQQCAGRAAPPPAGHGVGGEVGRRPCAPGDEGAGQSVDLA
ncbi:hypothetical protein [Frankia sp. AgKG'84/4]|nr:hypothetical protein [Frankia sp. AgKG'84/4]